MVLLNLKTAVVTAQEDAQEEALALKKKSSLMVLSKDLNEQVDASLHQLPHP